jgi:hypothetical protein
MIIKFAYGAQANQIPNNFCTPKKSKTKIIIIKSEEEEGASQKKCPRKKKNAHESNRKCQLDRSCQPREWNWIEWRSSMEASQGYGILSTSDHVLWKGKRQFVPSGYAFWK